MRSLALGCLLFAGAAQAHLVAFDFIAPSGAGQVSDGGVYALRWVDSVDSTGMTVFELYAARGGVGPFASGLDASVEVTQASVAIDDPLDLFLWDTRGLEPGCYQPYALVHDPIEGTSARPAAGVVTVAPTDGGNVPPSLWFVTVPSTQPDDAGNLALELDYEDPEDPGTLALEWYGSDHDGGALASGLPLPQGGGHFAYTLPRALLPGPGSYFLRAVAHSQDGRDCAVWWGGFVWVPGGDGGVDAGADAGTDAGDAADAGQPDAGTTPPPPSRGCGCDAAGGAFGLLGLIRAVLRRRAQRQE